MMKIFVVLLSALMLQACSSEAKDLKSPCVGIEGSPCGPHRLVNDWWHS